MTELFAVGVLPVFPSLPGGEQGCCCRTWVLLGQEVSLPRSGDAALSDTATTDSCSGQ